MKKIVLVLAVALLLVSSVVWADNGSESKAVRNRFTANANAWSPELTGHIKVGRVAVGNVGMIDFEDDTNIDDDDVYGITFRYELTKRTTLEFSYDGLDYDGRVNNLTQKFEFDNKVYDANGNISLGIKSTWYNLSVSRKFAEDLDGDRRAFTLVGRVGVKVNDSDLDVAGNVTAAGVTTRESHSWSKAFPVPYLGFEAATQVTDILGLKLSFNWLEANVGDYDASYTDLNVKALARLNRAVKDTEVYAYMGYRRVKYDVEGDNNDLVLDYSGPAFGIECIF